MMWGADAADANKSFADLFCKMYTGPCCHAAEVVSSNIDML